MSELIRLHATDGSEVVFFKTIILSDSLVDIYKTTESTYVYLFRHLQSIDRHERICNLINKSKLLKGGDLDFFKQCVCLPQKIIKENNQYGFVFEGISSDCVFANGRFKGELRDLKWYLSAFLYNKSLPKEEHVDFKEDLLVCQCFARLYRIFGELGFYPNDPVHKFLMNINQSNVYLSTLFDFYSVGEVADAIISPDYVAPEILVHDGMFNQICITEFHQRHILAVLIYRMLLKRHPLRGGKVWDADPNVDEVLSMGSKALFIEHPTDKSNRVNSDALRPAELPQADPDRIPYTICGPYLKELFDEAFIDGLHNPQARPTAAQWEEALVKTADLVQPCQNPNCEGHWYVFDNTKSPKCPFCGQEYKGQLPILNFYYSPSKGKFMDERYRLMVYDKQTLYKWHSNRFVSVSEKTSAEDKKPVGDFHFHKGQWILINRRLPDMYDVTDKKPIPVGGFVPLTEGRQILLDKSQGGRLIVVQLVKN